MREFVLPFLAEINQFTSKEIMLTESMEKYADEQCMLLFGKDELEQLATLKIDILSTLFAGKKSVRALYEKIYPDTFNRITYDKYAKRFIISQLLSGEELYLCRLQKDGEFFSLGNPERIICRYIPDNSLEQQKIAKKLEKLSKKNKPKFLLNAVQRGIEAETKAAKLSIISGYMKEAANDRRFVARFNEEKFYSGINVDGSVMNVHEVEFVFKNKMFNRYINIAEKPVRMALSGLYCLAFHGLTLEEIYTVGKIFTLDIDRREEKLKKQSGTEFLTLLYRQDLDNIAQAFAKMLEALMSLKLPVVDLSDINILRQNYTVYAAVANMGAAVIKSTKNMNEIEIALSGIMGKRFETAMVTAHRLMMFNKVVTACDSMANADEKTCALVGKNRSLSVLEGYDEAFAFAQSVKNMKTAEELIMFKEKK